MANAFPIPDDLDLLRHYAVSGDPAAFAELVRRHARMVFFTANRTAGRSDLAEDVAQDCFLKLARNARTIRGSVAAWLHKTALNRARETLRSDTARRRRETAYVTDTPDSSRSETIALIAIVDTALASLSEASRELIVEHYLSGIDQATLASRRGVDQSTISRRLQRALEELRESIGKRGGVASVAMLPTLFTPDAPAPPSVIPNLTKIGLTGISTKPALFGISGWALGGTVAAAVVGTGMLLLLSPDHSDNTNPASLPQHLAAQGWLESASEEDDAELEGAMAEIASRNVDGLSGFYVGSLGFRVVYRGQDGAVIVKRDDANIVLTPSQNPAPSVVNVFVEDVDATYAAVTRAGAKVDAPPAVGRFGLYGFLLTDPEGNGVRFLRETKLR